MVSSLIRIITIEDQLSKLDRCFRAQGATPTSSFNQSQILLP